MSSHWNVCSSSFIGDQVMTVRTLIPYSPVALHSKLSDTHIMPFPSLKDEDDWKDYGWNGWKRTTENMSSPRPSEVVHHFQKVWPTKKKGTNEISSRSWVWPVNLLCTEQIIYDNGACSGRLIHRKAHGERYIFMLLLQAFLFYFFKSSFTFEDNFPFRPFRHSKARKNGEGMVLTKLNSAKALHYSCWPDMSGMLSGINQVCNYNINVR